MPENNPEISDAEIAKSKTEERTKENSFFTNIPIPVPMNIASRIKFER